MGNFIPRDFKEDKVRGFSTLKEEFLTFHEYRLMFTHLSQYAPEIVVDIKSRMNLFVIGLSHQWN